MGLRDGMRALLANSQQRVNSYDITECQRQLAQVDRAATSFNAGLSMMASAARERASGELTATESKARIARVSSQMAPALKRAYRNAGGTVQHEQAVTENEIKCYGTLLTGIHNQLTDRIEALS